MNKKRQRKRISAKKKKIVYSLNRKATINTNQSSLGTWKKLSTKLPKNM
jgi:hypothetical protein